MSDTLTIQSSEPIARPAKRRRVVAEDQRKRPTMRMCRQSSCPGSSDILLCQYPCTVPCKKCGRTVGCRGVDKGTVEDAHSGSYIISAVFATLLTNPSFFDFFSFFSFLKYPVSVAIELSLTRGSLTLSIRVWQLASLSSVELDSRVWASWQQLHVILLIIAHANRWPHRAPSWSLICSWLPQLVFGSPVTEPEKKP